MSEYAQKKDESAAAWVARLARVSTAGLSGYVLSVLGSWKRDAAAKADGEAPAPARPPAGSVGSAAPAGAPAATPLDAAKRAARALSALDLARFTYWLTHGRTD